MDAFDERVKHMATTPEARRFQGPVIDVADTMETCKVWFESHEVSYTELRRKLKYSPQPYPKRVRRTPWTPTRSTAM